MCIQHKISAHLTQEDRFHIEVLRNEGATNHRIALLVLVDDSVISREIKRNKERDGSYCAVKAQKKYDLRRSTSKQAYRKIKNDKTLALDIENALRGDDKEYGDYSPEVIANTVCKGRISHTAIYAWIKRERNDLHHLLPHQGRRRKRHGSTAEYGTIQATKPRMIEDRPSIIETRTEIGHFEGDTVVLKEGRIHTLVERKSRFLVADFITLVGPGLAMQISESAVRNLSPFPYTHRKTITYDRGSEFAWWDETEKYLPGMVIYFAAPYHPWERGTNERTNGLIRRYLPKGRVLATLTCEDVAKVVWRLNHRPRRILNWCTPCEVFGECCTSGTN